MSFVATQSNLLLDGRVAGLGYSVVGIGIAILGQLATPTYDLTVRVIYDWTFHSPESPYLS